MSDTEEAREAMRLAEAALFKFVSIQPVHIGVAMARRLGKPLYQQNNSRPQPKSPGPKPETQFLTRWRNETIYRVWRSCYPELGSAAFAELMVTKNTQYMTSAWGYKSDLRRGEPPLDQLKSACYLIRAKGLAVPEKGLRNILAKMHKNSVRDFPG